MKTLQLDSKNNLIIRNGNLVFIDKADTVRQRVKNRLMFFQGEWFLDRDDGTPWFQQVFVTPVNLPRISSVIKQRILDTEGVKDITAFSVVDFDTDVRTLSISFEAETIYGDTIIFDEELNV